MSVELPQHFIYILSGWIEVKTKILYFVNVKNKGIKYPNVRQEGTVYITDRDGPPPVPINNFMTIFKIYHIIGAKQKNN